MLLRNAHNSYARKNLVDTIQTKHKIITRKFLSATKASLPLKLGRYLLTEKIADGGMSEVFMGSLTGPGGFHKKVAIKCLHSHMAYMCKFVELFSDEARLTAFLNHGNIVQVFDAGHFEGTHYIVLEYVHGITLAHLPRHKVLPFELALTIAMNAVAGLGFAHAATDENGQSLGIIHRDIAPKNILLSYCGQVKLTDFGVARSNTQRHISQNKETKGTLAYMPMEQLEGRTIDATADVYSMGATLYELFTGKRICRFIGTKTSDLLEVEPRLNIPPPTSVRTDLPKELDPVILQALAFDPRDRPPNGNAFLQELKKLALKLRVSDMSTELGHWVSEHIPVPAPGRVVYDVKTTTVTVDSPVPIVEKAMRFEKQSRQKSKVYWLRLCLHGVLAGILLGSIIAFIMFNRKVSKDSFSASQSGRVERISKAPSKSSVVDQYVERVAGREKKDPKTKIPFHVPH